jgi:hypothetical protein
MSSLTWVRGRILKTGVGDGLVAGLFRRVNRTPVAELSLEEATNGA